MTEISKGELAKLIGEFHYGFGKEFFIQTNMGNYVWSDPDYGGDNTIRRFRGSLKEFCRSRWIPYTRSKGKHRVCNYCGNNFTVVQ